MVPRQAYFTIAIIVEALFLAGLFCILTTVFKQFLAVLHDFVLLNHLSVLVTLELGERVSMLCLITSSFQLAHELVSLSCLGLDELLLLLDNLLERPAALYPSLKVLLDLLVPHLPAFNLFTDSTSLTLQCLNPNRL